MRTYILIFVFAMCTLSTFSQSQTNDTDIEVGAVLVIGKPAKNSYQHIDFPKRNIIMKRGGIANYKKVRGQKVVVTDILSKNGTTHVKIKRKDGGRFFGSHPIITADLKNALETKELLTE